MWGGGETCNPTVSLLSAVTVLTPSWPPAQGGVPEVLSTELVAHGELPAQHHCDHILSRAGTDTVVAAGTANLNPNPTLTQP